MKSAFRNLGQIVLVDIRLPNFISSIFTFNCIFELHFADALTKDESKIYFEKQEGPLSIPLRKPQGRNIHNNGVADMIDGSPPPPRVHASSV